MLPFCDYYITGMLFYVVQVEMRRNGAIGEKFEERKYAKFPFLVARPGVFMNYFRVVL